ncbi:hypothetical protein V8C86DRAFT_3146738 [Haematococcus lacustris]
MHAMLRALPCGGSKVGALLAGDFNASAGSALYSFMSSGALTLTQHDKRDMSGQIEGYGYSAYRRDLLAGRPPLQGHTPPTPPHTPPQAPPPQHPQLLPPPQSPAVAEGLRGLQRSLSLPLPATPVHRPDLHLSAASREGGKRSSPGRLPPASAAPVLGGVLTPPPDSWEQQPERSSAPPPP